MPSAGTIFNLKSEIVTGRTLAFAAAFWEGTP
jgi:hypothetical protein